MKFLENGTRPQPPTSLFVSVHVSISLALNSFALDRISVSHARVSVFRKLTLVHTHTHTYTHTHTHTHSVSVSLALDSFALERISSSLARIFVPRSCLRLSRSHLRLSRVSPSLSLSTISMFFSLLISRSLSTPRILTTTPPRTPPQLLGFARVCCSMV